MTGRRLLFLFALFFANLPLPFAQKTVLMPMQLHVSASWEQGGFGTAFVYPAKSIVKASFSLVDSKGKTLVSSTGFPYVFPRKEGGYAATMALLGVSALMPAGSYKLVAEIESKEGKQRLQQTIAIAPRRYKKTIIRMGKQGTDVKNNKAPERSTQAKRFFTVLGAFNANAAHAQDNMIWPITEKWRPTGMYGESRTFLFADGSKSGDFHGGQDLAGLPVGTPVKAAAAGRVVMAENRIVTGYTVILEHLPGVFSLYYHMNNVETRVGKKVKQGEMIGRLGGTGFATGPHLHFQVRISAQDIDPADLIKRPMIDKEFLKEAIKQQRQAQQAAQKGQEMPAS